MPAGARDSDADLAIHISRQLHEPSTQQSLFFTHCVSASAACAASARPCSEKNYRLQDIQLSKNPPTSRLSALHREERELATNASLANSVRSLRLRGFAAWPLHTTLRGTKAGGEYRARTGDLLVANQALSQLS